MNEENKIVTALVVGLLVWLSKVSITFFFKKQRIESALLNELVFLHGVTTETVDYLQNELEKGFIVGQKIEFGMNYTKTNVDFFKVYSAHITTYFGTENINKLLSFYRNFNEFEVLCDGLFRDVNEWKKLARQLNQEDVDYLLTKRNRAVILGAILSNKKPLKISDLPNNYKAKNSAGSIVQALLE